MVMNLQFFGGRGSESGIGGSKLKQITVNMGANSITYRNEGGKTYRVGQGNMWFKGGPRPKKGMKGH